MSSMLESLAQNRHRERYSAPPRGAARPRTASAMQGTRTRAGWLLVGLGLRLALPGRADTARRITLIGR